MAQLAAHPARIGERLVSYVGIEGGIQLINRLLTPVDAGKFSAGVLGGGGVKKRPRRRVSSSVAATSAWASRSSIPRAYTATP